MLGIILSKRNKLKTYLTDINTAFFFFFTLDSKMEGFLLQGVENIRLKCYKTELQSSSSSHPFASI